MEEKMELQDAAGGIEPGSCEGNWDANDPLCSRRSCMNSEKCERITKAEKFEKKSEAHETAESEEKDAVELSPFETLLRVLTDQYSCKTSETDKAKMFQFTKDNKPVIDIFVTKTGKVRFVSKKGIKTINGIDSIEQAEAILKELL